MSCTPSTLRKLHGLTNFGQLIELTQFKDLTEISGQHVKPISDVSITGTGTASAPTEVPLLVIWRWTPTVDGRAQI